MDEKDYKGFDDTNIEKDFKPEKSEEKISDLPKFFEEKQKDAEQK